MKVDKIASTARNAFMHTKIGVSSQVQAKAGNLIVVQALEEKEVYGEVELASGRFAKILEGDVILGVLGERKALKGITGFVPSQVSCGDTLDILNLGGIVGKATSSSKEVGKPLEVKVLGGVESHGKPVNITDAAVPWAESVKKSAPIVCVSGTCMNTGKTIAACTIIHSLKKSGLKVAAAKLSGVSLMRDVMKMEDYGAVKALSFTDAGLASTTCGHIVQAAKGLINELNGTVPDAIVVELGDGIYGEYGVQELLKDGELQALYASHIVCASDPAAAKAAKDFFDENGLQITAFAGPVSDNDVGKEFVRNALGTRCLNAFTQKHELGELALSSLLVKAKCKDVVS